LGAVPVLRTAGGHRRIPRKSLEDLLAQGGDLGNLLKLTEPAANESQASEACGEAGKPDLSPGEIASSAQPADRKLDVFAGDDLLEVQTEFRDALRVGLENRCRQLIDDLLKAGFSRSSAADFLMTKAMHQFGHMWEHGDLAVYQERRACGICMGLLHELKRSVQLAPVAPVAIGGTPRGDIYQLPTQMIELALCEAGWNATSLGCNLPIASFAEAVREYKPSLLWISLSSIEAEDSFVREFNELADSLGKDTALIIGGRAANDSLRPRLRYTAHCDSLVHLSELAAKFLKRL
jgi:methanogenic corrinoid protein MtbC1